MKEEPKKEKNRGNHDGGGCGIVSRASIGDNPWPAISQPIEW